MKIELLICDIEEQKAGCDFTVWYDLIGDAEPEAKLSDAFTKMLSLLNYNYIRGILNKSVICKIGEELVPTKYAKSDITVGEVYEKVRGEEN